MAFEAILLRPSSAPEVAAALGVHPRTARRILQTLIEERYVERRGGCGRAAHEYLPTVRLLSMAAQLAPRLPLVRCGRRTVREVEQKIGLTAYIAVPCYSEVLVIACTGDRTLRPWATLPDEAAGRVLLAHRKRWRESLAGNANELAAREAQASEILARGRAIVATDDERIGSLAVAVPGDAPPIAALGLRGSGSSLIVGEQVLVNALCDAAARLAAETRDWQCG